jgi:hypothetical protein
MSQASDMLQHGKLAPGVHTDEHRLVYNGVRSSNGPYC